MIAKHTDEYIDWDLGRGYYIHMGKRSGAGVSQQTLAWFQYGVQNNVCWADYLDIIPENHCVDILHGPDIGMSEWIQLVHKNNAMIFVAGAPMDVTEFLETQRVIYPGSFNPPHIAHYLMSDGALPEITVEHYFKGRIPHEDLIHRINMWDLHNRPVMLTHTKSCLEKAALLRSYCPTKNFGYRISSDVMNECTAQGDAMFGDDCPFDFQVVIREDIQVEQNTTLAKLKWAILDTIKTPPARSENIRQGDVVYLPPAIKAYIEKHGLYT